MLQRGAAPVWRSWLHQTVEHAGRVAGMVSVFAQRERAFSEPQRRMLTTVAAQVAMTLERLESVAEAERIHLESVVDAMGEGLLWIDGAWRLRMANAAARRLLEELSSGTQPPRVQRLGAVDLKLVAQQPQRIRDGAGAATDVRDRVCHARPWRRGRRHGDPPG